MTWDVEQHPIQAFAMLCLAVERQRVSARTASLCYGPSPQALRGKCALFAQHAGRRLDQTGDLGGGRFRDRLKAAVDEVLHDAPAQAIDGDRNRRSRRSDQTRRRCHEGRPDAQSHARPPPHSFGGHQLMEQCISLGLHAEVGVLDLGPILPTSGLGQKPTNVLWPAHVTS